MQQPQIMTVEATVNIACAQELRYDMTPGAAAYALHYIYAAVGDRAPANRPVDWDALSNMKAAEETFSIIAASLPRIVASELHAWIANAPPSHAQMAVGICAFAAWSGPSTGYFKRILIGAAGPAARMAVPHFLLWKGCIDALLCLPDAELRALVAPHTWPFPTISDRALGFLAHWKGEPAVAMGDPQARTSMQESPFYAGPSDLVSLCRRIQPSNMMLRALAEKGDHDFAREVHAACLASQLPDEQGDVAGYVPEII
jgi:hypothetical protein